MWLKDINIFVSPVRVSQDFNKVPYSPKSYATPGHLNHGLPWLAVGLNKRAWAVPLPNTK